MIYEFLVGWTIAETIAGIVAYLWRPALVLWALLGQPPFLLYLVAVVVALGWMYRALAWAYYVSGS